MWWRCIGWLTLCSRPWCQRPINRDVEHNLANQHVLTEPYDMSVISTEINDSLLIIYKSQLYGSEALMRRHPLLWPPLPRQASVKADTRHWLSCHEAPVIHSMWHWNRFLFFYSSMSHHKFTRVMIGVWSGCSQRTWLCISNGQQFAHLSAHTAHFTPVLTFFFTSLPTYYSPQHHPIFTSIGSLPFRNPYPTFFSPYLPPSAPSLTLLTQMVPSVLIEAIAQAHHAKCRWL